jgi:hypothetical protein
MRRFFAIGLALQLLFDVTIGAGAYLGVLPTSLHAVPHFDLVCHFAFIGGVAFFLDGLLERRPLPFGFWSLGGALVIAVAGIEEYLQRFSARRSSTWSDFFADVAGVVICVWLSRRFVQRAAQTASMTLPEMR